MNITPVEVLEELKVKTALPLDLINSRELGGYRLAGGRRVKRGLLLRTSRMVDASAEDLRKLERDYSLALILDMRGDDEVVTDKDPEIPGAKWVHTPIIDMEVFRRSLSARQQAHQEPSAEETLRDPNFFIKMLTGAIREQFSEGSEGLPVYAAYLESSLGQRNLGLFFHEIAKTEEGAVLWHCYTGKDRTGIAAGLLLSIFGADEETIMADYEVSNLSYAENVAKMWEKVSPFGEDDEVTARICGVLAGVHYSMMDLAWKYMKETWGSPEEYLVRACGVTPEEIEAIRERYTEEI
ncbi:MAG: tyrosine-protein phosphatase [Lachnospiraceae bacterium]|nr:tyrosine-protein phosphatase [Lachnospiraceae bacterium]